MLKLEKGDPKNLKGSVLTYLHNFDFSKIDPMYPALYISTSLEKMYADCKEKICAEIAKTHLYNKSYIEGTKMINRFASRGIPFNIFDVILDIRDIKSIRDIDGDVICAGKIEDSNKIVSKLWIPSMFYMEKYQLQQDFLNFDADDFLKSTYKRAENSDNYKKNCSREILDKITLFSDRLVQGINEKNNEEISKITRNMFMFSRGSRFYKEMINMIETAKSDCGNKEQTIKSHIEKIMALHLELYEDIVEIDEKIRVLKNEK